MENFEEGKIIDGVKNLLGLGNKNRTQQTQRNHQVFNNSNNAPKNTNNQVQKTDDGIEYIINDESDHKTKPVQTTALSLSSSERHRVNKAFDKIDFNFILIFNSRH